MSLLCFRILKYESHFRFERCNNVGLIDICVQIFVNFKFPKAFMILYLQSFVPLHKKKKYRSMIELNNHHIDLMVLVTIQLHLQGDCPWLIDKTH
jgi:hypothetical protein